MPDRGYCTHGIYGMVIAMVGCSSGCSGTDLSQLDCIIYIRAMARLLWLVTRVNYGT
jgi:hypothetical protein